MRKLSKQDVLDILYGCTILGTGGGGSLEKGIKMIEQDFKEGKEFILADLNEIPDDALIASPYVAGAISPDTEESIKKYAGLPRIAETRAQRAFMKLEEYYGKKFYGIIATELGGENTADAFHVAAQLERVIVDGDPAGRSVPELQHSTYYLNNIPITPLAVATEFGDAAVITEVANDMRAEALVRAMAVVSDDEIGVVDHPTTGELIKKSVIPGSISYSLKVGKALREAKEKGEDAAQNIVKMGEGKMLFRGTVENFTWETIDGFTVGDVVIKGIQEYINSSYKIWYKNEHIISWRDGEVDITVPDLICVVDKFGEPVTNPYYEKGMELSVFALPAPKEWQTARGLEVFGPRSFGFDVDYEEKKI